MPYILLICSTLFWSGNFVLSRGMHAAIPPIGLSFWRWFTALFILSFFALPHLWRQRQLAKKYWVFITVQGLLGVTGFNTLIYLAVQSTTAINAALVNSSLPVIIAVLSWLMYRETLAPRQWLGVGVSLSGVLLIIAKGSVATLLALEYTQGDLLVLVAAVFWALYSANLKRYPDGLHPLAFLNATVIVGVIGIFPLYMLELGRGVTMPVNWATIITICYVAVFASVLAFIFWNSAVRTIGANQAGPFSHLMPVFSTILAILFLGETITGYHMKGIVLIFTGIFLTTWRIRATKKAASQNVVQPGRAGKG